MKNKKRTMILIIIALIAVVGILVGTTYAYFTASVTNATAVNENVITTGTMALEFTDGPEVKLENAAPGSQVEKTFKVKNIGTVSTKYDVYFSELINRFADKTDLVYTLESSDGGYNTTSEVQVPSAPSKMVDQQSIGVNETHTYKLTVTFKETNDNQNDNANKTFSSKIDINKYSGPLMTMFDNGQNINQLMRRLASGSSNISWRDTLITSFERSATLDNTDNEVSVDGGLLYIWYDNGTIKYYTDAQNIYLNPDSSKMFISLSKLNSIDLSDFNASNVESMYCMFQNDSELSSITFGEHFNASNVIDMGYMFNSTSLTNLDLSSFDTSNVTNMAGLFGYSNNLNSVTFGEHFDTSKVTDMARMFYGTAIKELDLSGWNTSKVTDMGYMFYGTAINELDLSNWNTSSLKDFGDIFSNSGLKKINISNWNFSQYGTATDETNNPLYEMFGYKSIPLEEVIARNITIINPSLYYAFINQKKLKKIDISGINMLNGIKNMYKAFQSCENLEEIIGLTELDTSQTTNMNQLFSNAKKIRTLDLSNFDTSNVTGMREMFDGCEGLETIYVDPIKWNVNAVTNSSYMFDEATSLVGGSGTKYNSSHTDKEYARVDDPDNGKPGYLTLKS